MEKIYKCPKCGEKENLHYNYDYTQQHRPIKDVLCNDCGEVFEGNMPVELFITKTINAELTPKQKAQQLYTRAYSRWCFELSHEKNYITAKDIAVNICNEVLGYMGADRGYVFWNEIRDILRKSSHSDLYTQNISD